jgi:hypothetical protein
MAKSLFLHSFLLALTFCPSFSTAYSWHFNAPPTQCSNLSITVTGSDGVPPYRVLIIPFGPSPLSSNIDVRSTIDLSFDGDLTTVNFPVNYPAHSHFIAVVRRCTSYLWRHFSGYLAIRLTQCLLYFICVGQRCFWFRHGWNKCGDTNREF